MPDLVPEAESLGIEPRLPTAVIAQRCRALPRLGDDLWADGLVVFEDGKSLVRREQFATRDVPTKTGGPAQLLRFGEVLCLTLSKQLLGAPAPRDVIVGLKRGQRVSRAIALQGPAARQDYLGAIPPRVDELALPPAVAKKNLLQLVSRQWEHRTQKFVDELPNRLFLSSIHTVSVPPGPVCNHVVLSRTMMMSCVNSSSCAWGALRLLNAANPPDKGGDGG